MGVLADHQIRALCEPSFQRPAITPFAEGVKRPGTISYGESSYGYDMRLGTKFRIFVPIPGLVVDPKAFDERLLHDVDATETGYVTIPPNSYALGESLETFDIPHDCMVICIGKSTYARAGIIVNVTPLEPRWRGKLVIEISNNTPCPVKVYAGEGIAQLLFLRAEELCETTYATKGGSNGGKYQDQTGIVTAKVD